MQLRRRIVILLDAGMIVISWRNYDKLIYGQRHRNPSLPFVRRDCEQRYFTVEDNVTRNLFRRVLSFRARDSPRWRIDNSACHELARCVAGNYIDIAADNLSFSVPSRACRSHLRNESLTVVRRSIDTVPRHGVVCEPDNFSDCCFRCFRNFLVRYARKNAHSPEIVPSTL